MIRVFSEVGSFKIAIFERTILLSAQGSEGFFRLNRCVLFILKKNLNSKLESTISSVNRFQYLLYTILISNEIPTIGKMIQLQLNRNVFSDSSELRKVVPLTNLLISNNFNLYMKTKHGRQ